MPRQTKKIQPLFGTNSGGKITKNDDAPPPVEGPENPVEDEKEETTLGDQQEEITQNIVKELETETEEYERLEEAEELEDDYIQRFKKAKPKMETHQPFNTRIPKTLRKRIDAVERYYTEGRKNTGFLQEFTANALRAELEKAEKQMEEEKKRLKVKNKKPDQR
jgi:hypothetical protein